MCGIAGIIMPPGRAAPVGHLTAMADALRHRGPDDTGVWRAENVGFAHRRLAVIDPEGGAQPMLSPDGRTAVCTNGEVYNFCELRGELQSQGCELRSRCDTEVLLHVCRRDGAAGLAQLNGMFAFAFCDLRKRTLLLARDRFGQKPLYLFENEGTIAFASELSALRCLPQCPAELDPQAVRHVLAFQYVPDPACILCGVRKLPPGTFVEIDLDDPHIPEPQAYWSVPEDGEQPFEGTFDEAAEELRARVVAAVRHRLVADVPLGAFLSGGLDSACILAAMREAGAEDVRAFTIGCDNPAYDETDQAARTSAHVGATHASRTVDPSDFACVRTLASHASEPLADASILPTYLLSNFTDRKSVV